MNKSDALIPHLPTDVAFKELRRIDREIALAGLVAWTILGIGAILIIPKVGSGSLLDYILSAKNPSPPTEQTQSDRPQLKAIALSWVGKEFNPGQQAQCAYFVRHVLEEAGINLPLTQEPWDGVAPTYPGTANSFAGSDIVQRVDDLNEGEIGLAFFENTYGDYPPGTITHIGFAIKTDGVLYLVDRPTQSAPVRQIPLSGHKYLARIPSAATSASDPQVRAFLDAIAYAEGTAGEKGYQTIVGGSLFDDCSDHPRKSVPFTDRAGRRNTSNAAGRYQFLSTTWDGVARKLNLPDFCPESQDRGAIALLEENGAIALLHQGDFEGAVRSVRRVWASFPGAGYNQPEKSMDSLRRVYEQRLALYAND